jgi:hypothetical protein
MEDTERLSRIQANNLKLVKVFDKSAIANRILDFSLSEGYEGFMIETGSVTDKLKTDSLKKMKYFQEA